MWTLLALLACSPAPEPPPDWRGPLEAWRHPQPLPPLPFQDGDTRRTLQDLQGRWTLVAFVFTRCGNAEACPLTMQRLASLQDGLGSDVQIAVFTLDPAYDTAERLAAYADAHGLEPAGRILGTLPEGADPALLREGLPSLFNVYGLGEGPGMTHPTRVSLIAPDGTEAAHWEAHELELSAVRAAMR